MPAWRRISANGLSSMRRRMGRVLEVALPGRLSRLVRGERLTRLPLDVYEMEEEIVVVASVPGVRPEDVTITMTGNMLTILGRTRTDVSNVTYLLQERLQGTFGRKLTVRVPVDVKRAEAKFRDGVMTLILPKRPTAEPGVVRIGTRVE